MELDYNQLQKKKARGILNRDNKYNVLGQFVFKIKHYPDGMVKKLSAHLYV